MALKWWEKTVEYAFILETATRGHMFASPFDGNEESAGDAVFSFAKKWVLIEFKRDSQSLSSEKKKFVNYETAKAALRARDAHHHLVYGKEVSASGKSRLELTAQTFFSGQIRAAQEDIFTNGTNLRDFSGYLVDLLRQKSSSESGKGARNFMLVAGIDSNNKIVGGLSIEEFILALSPKREIEKPNDRPTPRRGMDGPSF